MLSAFALGLMNLAWMAALTTIVVLETLAPGGARIGQIAGVAMVIWGLTLLLHR
jgi:predicted metal-binding membrane protein